jgi:putative heme-binding domain-containing protein
MYGSIKPLLVELPERLRSKPEGKTSASARYVRVELDRKSILTLAEVQVFSQGENVAPRGQASQSGTSHGGVAERAIDGKTDGDWKADSCTATTDQHAPWWEVDLGANYPVDRITIWNRTDCCTERLDDFTLSVLDNNRVPIFVTKNTPEPSPRLDIPVDGADGVDVLAAAVQSLKHIPNHEAEIFGDMVSLIRKGTSFEKGSDTVVQSTRRAVPATVPDPFLNHQTNAIEVLLGIPRQFWSQDEIEPLAESLLASIGEIPPEQRTTAAATRASDLATQLTSALPAKSATSIHRRLEALRVHVIALGTVPHRMIYDKERMAVQAGSFVEFRFSNSDHMPHNLAIVQPGALEEVGILAEATGNAPDAAARHYIPKSDKVLLASRLLQSGERQTLSFQVPSTPGIYPYVCTYPGHWRRMYGALYVVDNLKDYEADRATYIAKHPLPMRDELLKYLERNTEWKLDELVAFVRPLSHGRSFDVGGTAFQVANCVACHRMDKKGNEFGPDLTKLDTKKFTPEQILRSLLEPSAEINEKFQTFSFLLDSGKVVTGMIVTETSSTVSVIVDPLVKADPITINKSEIEEQRKSAISIMPKGLLNKLTREEILDLIAYVNSRGDKDNTLFHAEHQH